MRIFWPILAIATIALGVFIVTGGHFLSMDSHSRIPGYFWVNEPIMQVNSVLYGPSGRFVGMVYGINNCSVWVADPHIELGTFYPACYRSTLDLKRYKRLVEDEVARRITDAAGEK